MPKIIGGSDIVDFIYYNHLPKVYSEYDKQYTKHQDLYKYLQASLYSGSEYLLDKSRGIKDLVDPLKCPEELLPLLYKCWGLEYFHDVGVYYNRVFLANIGEFVKRRGTIGGVQFIIRVLTGMDSDIEYIRKTKEKDGVNGRYLNITLKAETLQQANSSVTNAYVVSKFIKAHIPFYFDEVIPSVDIKIEILRNFSQVLQFFTKIGYEYTLPKHTNQKLKYKVVECATKHSCSIATCYHYTLN